MVLQWQSPVCSSLWLKHVNIFLKSFWNHTGSHTDRCEVNHLLICTNGNIEYLQGILSIKCRRKIDELFSCHTIYDRALGTAQASDGLWTEAIWESCWSWFRTHAASSNRSLKRLCCVLFLMILMATFWPVQFYRTLYSTLSIPLCDWTGDLTHHCISAEIAKVCGF